MITNRRTPSCAATRCARPHLTLSCWALIASVLAGGLAHAGPVTDGKGSFTFNNAQFFGYSLWEYSGIGLKNEAVWSNVRGCGQVVADRVNFNNVSLVGCAFGPTATVPEPANLLLLGIGLLAIGRRLRRKSV